MKITHIPISDIHTRMTSDFNGERPARRPVMVFDDPVVVIPVEDGYEIVDGLRRLENLIRDGATEAPVIIQDWSEPTAKMMRILLNGRRRTISWYEEALLIRDLHRNEKIPLDRIARQLGHKKNWVYRRERIVEKVSPAVLAFSQSGDLGLIVAYAISRLPMDQQLPFFLSVKEQHLKTEEVRMIVNIILEMDEEDRQDAIRDPGGVLNALNDPVTVDCHGMQDLTLSIENIRKKIRSFRQNSQKEHEDARGVQAAIKRLTREIECLNTLLPDDSGEGSKDGEEGIASRNETIAGGGQIPAADFAVDESSPQYREKAARRTEKSNAETETEEISARPVPGADSSIAGEGDEQSPHLPENPKIRIQGRKNDSRRLYPDLERDNTDAKGVYPVRAGYRGGVTDGLVSLHDSGGERSDQGPHLLNDPVLEPVSVCGSIHGRAPGHAVSGTHRGVSVLRRHPNKHPV